jgi:hypothetical protein
MGGPGERRAVGVGGVGGGQGDDAARLPGAEAVESAGKGELGPAEAFDEVTPADAACLVERRQDGV